VGIPDMSLSEVHAPLVSPPALRMAMKLVGRKLDGHVWAALSAKAEPEPTTSESPKRTVQFRGQRTTI